MDLPLLYLMMNWNNHLKQKDSHLSCWSSPGKKHKTIFYNREWQHRCLSSEHLQSTLLNSWLVHVKNENKEDTAVVFQKFIWSILNYCRFLPELKNVKKKSLRSLCFELFLVNSEQVHRQGQEKSWGCFIKCFTTFWLTLLIQLM